MRVIARKRLEEFSRRHDKARIALERWYVLTTQAGWRSIADVRRTFAHADPVETASGRTATVFNICGNDYRLIVALHYHTGRVYIMRFLTHAEYDKDGWKDE